MLQNCLITAAHLLTKIFSGSGGQRRPAMQHDEGTMVGGIFRCVGGTMDCSVTNSLVCSTIGTGRASLRSALGDLSNSGDAGHPGNLDGAGATR